MREFDCYQCKLSFKTLKELIKHKANSDRHEYCKRCDEDFENEEALLVHKILSQRHIACHVCGIDFKSESGKDAHVRQVGNTSTSPAKCKFCTKFTRAAALINHIEVGRCPVISAFKYNEIRQKKDVLKAAIEKSLAEKSKDGVPGAMLLDIGGAMRRLTIDDANRKAGDASSTKAVDDASSQSGIMDGGVSLLGGSVSSGHGSTKTMSYKQPTDLITGDNGDDDGDDDTLAIGNTPVQAPHTPVMHQQPLPPSSSSSSSIWNTQGPQPPACKNASTRPQNNRAAKSDAWARGAPPGLQPNPRVTMPPTSNSASFASVARSSGGFANSAESQQQQQQQQRKPPHAQPAQMPFRAMAGNSQNIEQSSLLDEDDGFTSFDAQNTVSIFPELSESVSSPPANAPPSSAKSALTVSSNQWDPQRFFNDVLCHYVCPCQKEFNSVDAFEEHVRSDAHMIGTFRCPGCLRIFKSLTALVAHCESASVRCSISKSENYSRIMDDISAGVLDTDGYNPDGSIKYKAKPVDLDSVQW
ncbi:hypothetical protein KEM54_002448 [Ascosphaera aggregata]|nr:hypothetical protein KEM54_002448 [Ascosphaera aggregata]